MTLCPCVISLSSFCPCNAHLFNVVGYGKVVADLWREASFEDGTVPSNLDEVDWTESVYRSTYNTGKGAHCPVIVARIFGGWVLCGCFGAAAELSCTVYGVLYCLLCAAL